MIYEDDVLHIVHYYRFYTYISCPFSFYFISEILINVRGFLFPS